MVSPSPAGQSAADFAPVSRAERVEELDVLRGLALFGILVVNILDYAPPPASMPDRVTAGFINVLAEGSFYPLFSLLFGVVSPCSWNERDHEGGPLSVHAGLPTTVTLITVVANTALTLAYASGVVLLLAGEQSAWRTRLAPLALVGRMGLTNYLLQSLAMSLLFLPYGLRSTAHCRSGRTLSSARLSSRRTCQ